MLIVYEFVQIDNGKKRESVRNIKIRNDQSLKGQTASVQQISTNAFCLHHVQISWKGNMLFVEHTSSYSQRLSRSLGISEKHIFN